MIEDSRNRSAEVEQLKSQLRDLTQTKARLEQDLEQARQELGAIHSGVGWRALQQARRVRMWMFPPRTRRDRAFRRLLLGLEAAGQLGAMETGKLLLTNPRRLVPALRAARADAQLLNRQYQAWLERHELTSSQRETVAANIRAMAHHPVISMMMPVYNIEATWLEQAVDSVRQQLYPHWELCLVDDASTAPHIAPLLKSFAASDSRIKLKLLTANEGISGASNHALSLATGEFVGPLDHDDMLAPDALYEVAVRLNADPSIDLVYTDHDLRDVEGHRRSPFFKPDWSPDLLLSMNYITHLSGYRRSLVERVGGFRKGLEGSQDYDLLLRVTEQTQRIAHVAKPLYSWCQAPTSVSSDPQSKPYAHEAGRRALQDALVRRGIAGEVLDGYGAPYRYRVKRRIIGEPLVSIIIPTRDNRRLLERCLESLDGRTAYRNFEIIVVDNESRDPDTVDYLRHLRHRVVPFPGPFDFAEMNNVAAATARGEHLLFLNDDTEVIAGDWLEAMLEHSQRAEVGVVGPRLLFPNDTIQHAGVVIGIMGKAGHAFWGFPDDHPGYYDLARVVRNYSAVTGACLMTRRAVFEEVNGFDRAFAVSYNDVDLCLRIRERGYLVVYTPYARLYHHQSASRGEYDAEKDRQYEDLLRSRWHHVFEQGDPYYNPQLTLTGFDFSMRS